MKNKNKTKNETKMTVTYNSSNGQWIAYRFCFEIHIAYYKTISCCEL